MALLELVVTGSYYDQLIVNRFHYVASGTPAAVTLSFGLMSATGFQDTSGSPPAFQGTTIAVAWQSNVSDQYKFVAAYVRDLYSVTDFYERPYPVNPTGGVNGEAMSPAMAYGFKGSRVRTDIRRAQKRFVGVPEANVGSGGLLLSGTVSALTGLGTLMDDTLTYDDEGNTLTFVPAVLGLEEYTTPKGNRAYRIHPTLSEQLNHVATGFTYAPYASVRTQVSRQYGRGA
jgi:hypothetical protein